MFRKEVSMSINKIYIGFLLALCVAITGCDGDVESMGDITVNVEGDDNSIINNNQPDSSDDEEDKTGLCAEVEEADFVSFNDDCSQGTVTGTIDSDYTFIEDVDYILSGVVKVGDGNVEITSQTQYESILSNGVTLTIEPGVEVKGTADGVLLVTRGSKLMADAYANNPISFSSLDDNYDGTGEWG